MCSLQKWYKRSHILAGDFTISVYIDEKEKEIMGLLLFEEGNGIYVITGDGTCKVHEILQSDKPIPIIIADYANLLLPKRLLMTKERYR